jgi:hypothetical protein
MVKLNYKMVSFIRTRLLNGNTVGQVILHCDDKIKQHTKELSPFKKKKLHRSQRTYISRVKKRSKFLKGIVDFLLKAPQDSIEEISRHYTRYQELPKGSK